MRMVVVLPEPFGPMNPYTEPSGTASDRSSTAVTLAKGLGDVQDSYRVHGGTGQIFATGDRARLVMM